MGVSSISSSLISTALSTDSGETSQSEALKTVLSSLNSQQTLFDVLAENDKSSSYDILDLSSEGQSAADSLTELLESASLASVQKSVNALTSSIQEKITAALTEAGIDTSEEIELEVDSEGNVVVTNDNAQADAIEEAINNDAELKEAVVEYFNFMKAMAPTLTSTSSSDTTTSNSTLEQLLAALGASSTEKVTLSLTGDSLEATYVDTSSNSHVLASC